MDNKKIEEKKVEEENTKEKVKPTKEIGAIIFFIIIVFIELIMCIMLLYYGIHRLSFVIPALLLMFIVIALTVKSITDTVNTTINETSEEPVPEVSKFPQASEGTPVKVTDYPTFVREKTENVALKKYINMILAKNKINKNSTLPSIEKRKNILTIIYCLLLFITITSFMAYHTHIFIEVIFLVVLTVFYIKMSRRKVIEDILIKEIKARPDEKMENIIVSKMQEAIDNNNIFFRSMTLLLTIAVLLLIFSEPHMIFEETPDGYYLRYYTIGIFNNQSDIKIPAKYKNKDVVGIRGSVFENMIFIKNIQLPETIKEIRGAAFKNCINLESINLPLQLKEIHGSTFEYCPKLKSINIPEGVIRIGGSAFRDDSSLTDVVIPKTVMEIGSSAFRATNIQKVCISNKAYVNERAFKETNPTIVYYENDCEQTNFWGDNNEWGEYE